jgi:hypothetical protein
VWKDGVVGERLLNFNERGKGISGEEFVTVPRVWRFAVGESGDEAARAAKLPPNARFGTGLWKIGGVRN